MTAAILLLNSNMTPISTIPLKRAVSLLCKEAVDVVESVPGRLLRSANSSQPFPSVLRLRYYVNVPDRKASWSRHAVFKRDHYTCQYCGKKLDRNTATLDHIIPVSVCKEKKIHPSTFGNSCCSCEQCNRRKSSRTMRDAGMRFFDPKFEPKTPRVSYLIISGDVPESWRAYIRA